MAINIGENQNEQVTYVNSPDINRVLFKNLKEGASKEDIVDAVNAWLDEHPEATTTVEDGSILPVKLDSTNSASDGYVLSYNATAGKFEWVDIQSDITELKNDLSGKADKSDAYGAYVTATASGAIASFDDGADNIPVKDLTVQIVPVQSGTGDPSPENVRPISGWTGCNISKSGADTSDPEIINIDWTTEAGTVYGGTLDVTSGLLTVDRITKTLDENASWSFSYNSETGLAQASINNVFASEEVVNNAGTPNYCNQAVFVRSESGTVPAGKFTIRSYARNFRIGIDGITTEEAWISHVTSNPIQICMVLSPSKHVTYQLTPTEVSTLLGQNNIWADCGDTIVDYRADTKLYIEKLTAPTEDDMTANNTIPDATYFMIGNNLYLSTTTIPAGDTINPGTNCTQMNLAAALNAINA